MTTAASAKARQITVPDAARQLCTLGRIDYQDAHRLETDLAQSRTAERWVRLILEDAPGPTRMALRTGWASLGLRLGFAGDRYRVLGWRFARSEPDVALLVADRSHLGLDGEVMLMREDDALMVATFLQLDGPVARGVWIPVAPGHRQVVRHMLEEGVRRAAADG